MSNIYTKTRCFARKCMFTNMLHQWGFALCTTWSFVSLSHQMTGKFGFEFFRYTEKNITLEQYWWSGTARFLTACNDPETKHDGGLSSTNLTVSSWWRHQKETCSALLALCVGISPATSVVMRKAFPCHDVIIHYLKSLITMTSLWARWRLISPASRLFTQAFIQSQIKENIKAPRQWPLWGDFTGDRWIARTKGQ